MKRGLPVLCVLLGLGSCFSRSQVPAVGSAELHTPLEGYITGLRQHKINGVAAGFATICGVKLNEASHRFAFANDDAGRWKIVPSLPEAYDNLEMDLVGTAEVWKNPAGTVVEEWQAALDVGGFGRTLYCFDTTGRLKALDSTNYQISDDGRTWGMHERWLANADGTFRADIPFEFVGLDDKPISRPKLDEDDKKFESSWGKRPPERITYPELKLPPDLFR